jgi:hypothetical protein
MSHSDLLIKRLQIDLSELVLGKINTFELRSSAQKFLEGAAELLRHRTFEVQCNDINNPPETQSKHELHFKFILDDCDYSFTIK